ncbi:hypothetical protein D9V37_09290 [Nocardioides mangrovicus]|uniref:Peptidase M10 metallopeptidase domain-containing protein n=1 Tax=Nocardioides mangrovicus TaxID=2478913 RepID=A0A3L8P3S2_9ACTN|nr:hypothetical protein [Nocardioides mangrovicus]RLV50046.1 hypothetical protein D9V37_09290 [Nocardioides mangrovicus]
MPEPDDENRLVGLSRREIDALVSDLIRAEDSAAGEASPPAGGRHAVDRPAAEQSLVSGPAGGSSVLDWLRHLGAAVSVVLVICAALVLVRWWPHYSERGLPSGPRTYADGHYAFLLTQSDSSDEPVGFDPCTTVQVAIDTDGATSTIRSDVERVVASIDQVSGLHLTTLGVGETLSSTTNVILVSFQDPSSDTHLNDTMIGVGGFLSVRQPTQDGTAYVAHGFVTLNRHRYNSASHDSQLLSLARQFGHAVGLANINGHELMSTDLHQGVRHFGHGDLTGLALLGRLPCAGASA